MFNQTTAASGGFVWICSERRDEASPFAAEVSRSHGPAVGALAPTEIRALAAGCGNR
jgi:hypothetical protein